MCGFFEGTNPGSKGFKDMVLRTGVPKREFGIVVKEIETKALVAGGANAEQAFATVRKAIQALKDAGFTGPTRIPWGGK